MEGASSSSSVRRDGFLVWFLWAKRQRAVALRGHGAGLRRNSPALGTFRAGRVGVSPSTAIVHRHFISVSAGLNKTKHFSLSPLLLDLRRSLSFPQEPRTAVALTQISRTAKGAERRLVQRLPSPDRGLPLCSPALGTAGEETQIFRTFLKKVIYVSFSL